MQVLPVDITKLTRAIGLTVAIALLSGLLVMPSEVKSQTPGGDGKVDSLARLAAETTYGTRRLEAWRAGVYLGLNFNIYTADNMRGMPGVPNCCPGFNSGGGLGIAAGGLAETPVNEWFSVGGRLYLSTYNGALTDQEGEVVDDGGAAADAIFEHRIDADIWSAAIEPIGLFEVAEDVKVFAGVRGDLILRKLFAQKEEILEPSDIAYENGSRTRLEYSGAVPNGTSFQGAIVAGIRYDIYVGESREWVVAPELSGWYSPTPVIQAESWRTHGVRLAVSGQYIRYEQEEYPIDPVIPPLDLDKTGFEALPGPAGGDSMSDIGEEVSR